ncbi:MAG TPA: OsmC family protein [Miltoncostaeaceae bacterium]|jgi:uncharacterized OsmC-like protein|nr:OsmC family protein [Miltoncostaeaceae bacterium]
MATTASERGYVTRVRVSRENPPIRIAELESTGDRITFGLPTWQSEFYNMPLDGEQARHAGTWDHLLACVASCLTGNMGTALSARRIPSDGDRLSSEAEADIEVEDGILVMKRIRVHYRVKGVPEDRVEAAQRALDVHVRACGIARAVSGSVEISTTMELV